MVGKGRNSECVRTLAARVKEADDCGWAGGEVCMGTGEAEMAAAQTV